MFRNYLVTALRNIVRHKLYSFINICGLTVGFVCAIFIGLFVRDELSYDRWIPGTENLYRVQLSLHYPGQAPLSTSFVAFPVPDAMLAGFPEVKAAAHLQSYHMTVETGSRQFLDRVNVVSPNFLSLIQLPLVAGNRATLFTQPESAVITESAARRYFPDRPAVGQVLKVGGQCGFGEPGVSGCVIRHSNLIVRGVLRDLPHNSQLAGDMFIPNTSMADPMAAHFKKTSWLGAGSWGYVQLTPGADVRALTAKLPALLDANVDPSKTLGISAKAHDLETLDMTPFRDDHLSSDYRGGSSLTPAGSWATVYGFAFIGVLVLLIAGFNFTNLATARAMMRAREISLRKVVGARRGQLIVQFLGESSLMALLGLVLAAGMVESLLPLYDRMLGRPIQLHYLQDWPLFLGLIGVAILVGVLGGLYPALVLSRFRPASTLKTYADCQTSSGFLRGMLVTMQFAFSIGLGIAALVVFAQTSFARSIELGLNKDGIVVIYGNGLTISNLRSMVRVLDGDPTVTGATLSSDVPFSGVADYDAIEVPGRPGTSSIDTVGIGPDFFRVYGIRLLAGRGFVESHGQDLWNEDSRDANIIINQAAARYFGYSPQGAIGKTLYADQPWRKVKRVHLTIVGVTSNFMFKGNSQLIAPAVYAYDVWGSKKISVRVAPANARQALVAIDRIWHVFAPSMAINRRFLEEDFEKQFRADEQQGRMFAIFVGIAIFISCLGVFGLAAFTAGRRTREMGIRKVFGARTPELVLLLLWQFSVPVLIANVIAWPVAWYWLHDWLQGFAYRIALSPLYFLAAGAAAMLIAWVTVFVHAWRVANANPVHALRYD